MTRSSKKSRPPKLSVSALTHPEATVKALKDASQAQVKKYKTVKNTAASYSGQLSRGRKFLSDVVAKRRENGEEVCAEGIKTDELETAFEKPPNRYSALALELFLVHKCFNENLGKSTADSIHGAFAGLWDNMDGDNYTGDYSIDDNTGEIRGCPARAANVKAIMDSIKIRAKSKGASATRHHADAMTLEEIQKIMRWSSSICPDALLTDPESRNITDLRELNFRLEHAFMRAFMSSAFTLWTRCFELLSLQAGDIEEDCVGPAPYYITHFKVHLTNRKGWQKEKGYDGPRTSNIYDIYQQDIPQIDMYSHMIRWRTFLEGYLGVKLQPEDFLFPHLSTNGVIRTPSQMSYDSLQVLLAKFCNGAGVAKKYTTHSFRRGGAQYRFMYAPIGRRWSLNRIRWWGGWAVGEHVDTLIKYLVDSLQSFENGHGNALHPIPIEGNRLFMGDQAATDIVTGEEFRQFGNAVNQKLDDFIAAIATSGPTTIAASAPALIATSLAPAAASLTQCHCHVSVESASWIGDNVVIPESSTQPVVNELLTSFRNPSTESSNSVISLESSSSTSITNRLSILALRTVSIPRLGREPGAWRRAVSQWEDIDPTTGVALRDWPSEWYRHDQRLKLGSLRSQRLLVYEEYERLGRNDDRFRKLYPNADKSMARLLTEIRQSRKLCRSSKKKKNTPEYSTAATSSNTSRSSSVQL